MYLDKISNVEDIKKLQVEELQGLADETRTAILHRISNKGGHIGPNLGVVELSVAMHYVFDSPMDKIVFDVSHQCYAHKILTGRKEGFLDESCFKHISGYTNPLESAHDHFVVGHTSTSISLALGLAKARDVNKKKENIIAFIGDGSLSGGQALEALNYAGEYDKNLIIIVNDNDQSIAENHGGLYTSLKALRESNGTSSNNIFTSFGLDYMYVEEGHDIPTLVKALQKVKDISNPIVLHIHTIKGKGLPYAEIHKEAWHGGSPFHIEDGTSKVAMSSDDFFRDSLMEVLDNNEKAIVVNAATPGGLGFTSEIRHTYASRGQFIDVGIAEENAVGICSGIATNGGTAIFTTLAAFFQRTYDQMSHDVCLNNSPITFITQNAGVFGSNSNTHLALCDIQMFAHLPNLVYLVPTTQEEYKQMLMYATTQKEHPVGIRLQKRIKKSGMKDTTDYSKLNTSKVIWQGSKVAIIAVGLLLDMAIESAKVIKEKTGVEISVINPVYVSGVDNTLLDSLKENHELVITLEDGELFGGYGQTIASYYGNSSMKVQNYGISKVYHTDFNANELLEENGMSTSHITNVIIQHLGK